MTELVVVRYEAMRHVARLEDAELIVIRHEAAQGMVLRPPPVAMLPQGGIGGAAGDGRGGGGVVGTGERTSLRASSQPLQELTHNDLY